jgi:PAS domain S-box-containing protein
MELRNPSESSGDDRSSEDEPAGSARSGLAGEMVLAALATPTVILGVGILASGSNYLLFHTLVELFTIVIALTALAVASTSRWFTRNHFTVFVAVAVGWCSALDAMHVLSFRGMGLFPVDDAGLTTQFWIAARLLQAGALLCSPLFLRRSAPVRLLHVVFAGLASGLVLWIMSGTFPETYVEGRGLTDFKVYAEYLAIAMMLGTAVLLWRQRRLMTPKLSMAMQAALVLMIVSEFSFTRYVSDYERANELGHFLRVYAYWFIYLALVQSTLREPFSMLSRTAGTYEAIPNPVCLIDETGAILQANRAASQHAGIAQEELVGRPVHTVFHAAAQQPKDCPVCQAMARHVGTFRTEITTESGQVLECTISSVDVFRRRGHFVHVVRDFTERERMAKERETLVHSLGERVKELRCLYAISEVLDTPGDDVPKVLAEVVRLLPPAFLYPQYARAALNGETGFLGTQGAEAARFCLTRDLIVGGRKFGSLQVFYDADLPLAAPGESPFLSEEQALLGTVAQRAAEAIERMEAAEKVRSLTYLYDMLSGINRAIVRCDSANELLQHVFEALIQHGTFPMLFIATATQGGLPLRHVHSHGIDIARHEDLDAFLADPGGLAGQLHDEIRKGQVICRKIFRNGAHGPWLQYLAAEGMEEVALMPLLCNGRVFGVICLFARGSGAFDLAHLRLLNEMAGDLEFALNGLSAIERNEAAEQRATISEARFHEVFESSPAPMLIVSVSSKRVRAINRACQQWLGYELSDIPTEDDWFEKGFADSEVRQELKAHWQVAVEKAKASAIAIHSPELRLRTKNGEERIAQGTMTLVGQDAIVAWTDLTDIRRTEEALRASESHFRNMIEQTITGIYVRRGDRFIYVNPSYCRIVGWSREELLAGNYGDFIAGVADNVRRVHEAWDKLAHGETSVRSEVRMVCKNGESRELGLHATPIQWDNESAVFVMASDITERKQAEQQIANYVKQLEASMRGSLQAVANMIDLRDPYTAGHERRVGLVAGAIARELGWSEERVSQLEMIGLVHDIGKIAVPAEILSKPGRLSPVEMELVRGHAQAGYDILKDIPFSFPVADIIYQHHERLDGSGYPRGLKGEEILPEARILCVADVLESISAHRPYRPALGIDAALGELDKGYGVIYDAEVIDAVRHLVHEKGYVIPK